MDNTYPDRDLYICADCGHEWPQQVGEGGNEDSIVVKDAKGQILSDGDSVVLIKDLKIKGILQVGGDHAVNCKTDAGSFLLKAEFLKKP